MTTSTVDMHSTGEAIRIIFNGPDVQGTLLQQRTVLQQEHEDFRRQLILEPRGHRDMYGAYLRPKTELVEKDRADIGVLFMSNAGYPTMCGHAIIALGRLLVDLDDPSIFQRDKLVYHAESKAVIIRLHAPCGVISVKVSTLDDGKKSDPNKPVSFYSVPSFVTGIDIKGNQASSLSLILVYFHRGPSNKFPLFPENSAPNFSVKHALTSLESPSRRIFDGQNSAIGLK